LFVGGDCNEMEVKEKVALLAIFKRKIVLLY